MSSKFTKTIRSHSYEIGAMPAMYNTNLFIRFSAMVGDSLADFFAAANSSDLGLIGKGISNILKSIYLNDPKGAMILDIMSQTTRDGRAINHLTFDEFYTGNIEEMTEALTESIMVHFKPFLPIDLLSGFLIQKEAKTSEITEN